MCELRTVVAERIDNAAVVGRKREVIAILHFDVFFDDSCHIACRRVGQHAYGRNIVEERIPVRQSVDAAVESRYIPFERDAEPFPGFDGRYILRIPIRHIC